MSLRLCVLCLVMLTLAACGSAGPEGDGTGGGAATAGGLGGNGDTGSGGGGHAGGGQAGGGTSGAGGGTVSYLPDGGVSSGLPCEVQQVLEQTCWTCHGVDPSLSAPVNLRLVTLQDLKNVSSLVPSQTNAERAVTRMQASGSRMPPLPAAASTNAQISTLQEWISSGYPAGSCVPTTPDGGVVMVSPDAGTPTPTDPLLSAAPSCTSGISWFLGDLGNSLMNPGKPCIACHAMKSSAPKYGVAGTVYPTGHEPDLCGAKLPSGTTVVITDANGAKYTLTPNADGNFYRTGAIALPYKASVFVGARERKMTAAQMDGDCNACHTQNGSSQAPGRITVPY